MFSKHKDLLIFIVRLIIGGIFLVAGYMKAADMATTVDFFGQLGFAAFLAYVVTAVELVAGAFVVLGYRIDNAALALSIIMLGAIYASMSMGFQGVMAPLAILASLLAILSHGTGKYAVVRSR